MFEVGQKVVYPNHGVSVVESIANDSIDGVQQKYYHLRVLANDSKVMVPEENLDLVCLRPLVRLKEIRELFALLEDGNIDTYKDWKGRYKQNLDKMRTGRLIEVAEVLKNLRLVSEVAHVRGIPEPDAVRQVEQALDSSLAKRHKAPPRAC